MKSQSERDGQTVTIATTLALLVGVMLLAIAVLWLLELVTEPSSNTQRTAFIAALAIAALVSGWYLVRHRRP